jgi:hypothetical protein
VEDAVSYLAVHRLRSRLAHRSLDDLAKLICGQTAPSLTLFLHMCVSVLRCVIFECDIN